MLGLIGMLIFSGTVPMTRIAVLELPWQQVIAARMCMAGIVSLILIRWMPRPDLSTWPLLAGSVAGLVFGWPVLMTIAMQTAPAAHGAVVAGLLPISTAVAAVFINHERPSRLFWVAAVIGSALVCAFALRAGGATLHGADWLLLGAVLLAGIGYACAGRLSKQLGPIATIIWANTLALPVALIWFLSIFNPTAWQGAGLDAIGAVFYLALFSQLIGFFFWNRGLVLGGVARIGQLLLLMPFASLALAAWLLDESITNDMLIFALGVAVCVGVTMRSREGG